MDRRGKALLAWLNDEESGPSQIFRWTPATVHSYATAIRKVLDSQPEGRQTDLGAVDLDDVLGRFEASAQGEPEATVYRYVSAFRSATEKFLDHCQRLEAMEQERRLAGQEGDPRIETWNFPVRRDLTLRLQLPIDLTVSEAERIGKFVMSLAVEANG